MSGKGRFEKFMQGRNGFDRCARDYLTVALVIVVVDFIVGIFNPYLYSFLSGLAVVLIAYGYFRILSRNIARRQEENRLHCQMRERVLAGPRRLRSRMRDWRRYHREYRLYRCKGCGRTLRVPKGAGSVKVTCPECKTSFTTKA